MWCGAKKKHMHIARKQKVKTGFESFNVTCTKTMGIGVKKTSLLYVLLLVRLATLRETKAMKANS